MERACDSGRLGYRNRGLLRERDADRGGGAVAGAVVSARTRGLDGEGGAEALEIGGEREQVGDTILCLADLLRHETTEAAGDRGALVAVPQRHEFGDRV